MLQAKIFSISKTVISGETMTVPQMAVAVAAFNANAQCGLVTFDDYPGNMNVNLGLVAGTATLHIDGDNVIALVKLSSTPMGIIAKNLVQSGAAMHIMPVTSVGFDGDALKLIIRHLVIPANPGAAYGFNSALHQMQNWVQEIQYWTMFELQEHK